MFDIRLPKLQMYVLTFFVNVIIIKNGYVFWVLKKCIILRVLT